MEKLPLFRFKFLAAFAVALGTAFSLWASTWPGYIYDRTDCYISGWVTWQCYNEDGSWWDRVPETIFRQDQNIICFNSTTGPMGAPAPTIEENCTATVTFPVFYCPADGPAYQTNYEETANRSIPLGRDVTYCTDPG